MGVQGVLATAISFAAIALLLLLARRRPTRRPPSLGLDPADVRELDALGRLVAEEHSERVHQLVAARLQVIVGRGVPVAAVEPTGIQGRWLLRFADSTALVVESRHPGDMAVLSMRLMQHRVRLVAFAERPGATELDVSWGLGHLRLDAVGVG